MQPIHRHLAAIARRKGSWIALESSAEVTNTNVVTFGGTAVAGELILIVAAAVDVLDSPATPPTGYTELYDSTTAFSDSYFVWYKIAAGGETSATLDTTAARTCAVGMRFSGVNQSTPINQNATGTTGSSNPGTTVTFPSVTTTAAKCFIVRCGFCDVSKTWTADAGITLQHDIGDPSDDDACCAVFTDDNNPQLATGATGTATATIASDDWLGMTIALAPV